MKHREYNAEKDKKAVIRIWQEVGWIDKDIEADKIEVLNEFFKAGKGYAAEIRGEAEGLVTVTPASIKYLDNDLSLAAVTSVTTSRIARKRGIASRLTAQALAQAKADGYHVAGLGIFDQGFYNKLGFGNGYYNNWIAFEPSSLMVPSIKEIPCRIGKKDIESIHECRLRRMRIHGNINILPEVYTLANIEENENSFGLGFYNKQKLLTHHLWMSARGENGPYTVCWLAYQNYDQLMQLFSLIKSFEDQVFTVLMKEPADIQIQDLLSKPFRYRTITGNSKHENYMKTSSYQQFRILDLQKCWQKISVRKNLSFNMQLEDPIGKYLSADKSWSGLTGEYIVRLGPSSSIEKGHNDELPVLTASVGALTRMWLGTRRASSLAVTDNLQAPDSLLARLDKVLLCIPTPRNDWDF